MPDTLKKYDQLPDWANLAVAGLLVVAPFFLVFVNITAAAWNAWIVALVIAGLAIAAILRYAEWEEWINALLGLWLLVSPWILGFTEVPAALWTHVVLGVFVALFAAWRGAIARISDGREAHA